MKKERLQKDIKRLFIFLNRGIINCKEILEFMLNNFTLKLKVFMSLEGEIYN